MNIDIPLRELGPVDSTALRDAVLAQVDRAWQEDIYRQEAFEVQRSIQSIVVLFVDIDRWPDIVVEKEPGWPRLADAALPVMNDITTSPAARSYAMAAKLVAGGKITPHVDRHPSFHHGHRIHVPISTSSRVRFMIDGKPY
ncbi:MAG TPA: hypothetical protein VFY27_08140 [Woeseiaceae bacterium]|nr:hypothetical protein [Woeseiaceae bacterium]